jgi:hypothetical protein
VDSPKTGQSGAIPEIGNPDVAAVETEWPGKMISIERVVWVGEFFSTIRLFLGRVDEAFGHCPESFSHGQKEIDAGRVHLATGHLDEA